MPLVTPSRNLVSVAVDLSRLSDDPIAESQLADIMLLGREVDLLEALRRSDRGIEIPLDLLKLQATRLRIAPQLFDIQLEQQFEKKSMISVIGDDKIKLLYETSIEVYNYGLKRIVEVDDQKQIALLETILKAWKKPVPSNEFFDVLGVFHKPYRSGLWNFIVGNKVLIPFKWNQEAYLVSHRLYKDEKRLKMALEILEEQQLGKIVDFLQNNPGNPLPVASRFLKIDEPTLYLLVKYGILEPIKLEVQGDAKEYLFSPHSTLVRKDKDHFDLVKMTLANFRFGEYYSKKSRLWSLDKFLSSMLDRGYAGLAEAIGTDYKNLEETGVVKVQRITANRYRFWLLKRDVIEDCRDIVKGVIPIQSRKNVGDITNINNLVQTRRQIDVELAQATREEIVEALRQIQEGVCS